MTATAIEVEPEQTVYQRMQAQAREQAMASPGVGYCGKCPGLVFTGTMGEVMRKQHAHREAVHGITAPVGKERRKHEAAARRAKRRAEERAARHAERVAVMERCKPRIIELLATHPMEKRAVFEEVSRELDVPTSHVGGAFNELHAGGAVVLQRRGRIYEWRRAGDP